MELQADKCCICATKLKKKIIFKKKFKKISKFPSFLPQKKVTFPSTHEHWMCSNAFKCFPRQQTNA